MPKASTYPARALTNIIGIDVSGNVGLFSSAMLTGQFGITASGLLGTFDTNSWMTLEAPNTKSFLMTTRDSAGNRTRTWDLSTGRMDLYGNSAGGAVSGSALVVAFDNATPANNDILGHFAHRGRDSNLNFNTFSYVLGTAKNVNATGSNLSSALTFGVMVNATAGAGNAQPNTFMVLDGSASQLTMPSGFQISLVGNSVPISATHTAGPEFILTNSTNSRVARFGVGDNFNTTINSTGGGGILLQAAGTTAISIGGLGTTRFIAETRSSKTTNYTALATDGGTAFDNTGAAGEVDFTLPAAPTVGTRFAFMVIVAQTLKVIAPASTTINVGGTVSATAGNIAATQIGASVELTYVGSNKYVAKLVTGTGGSTGAGGWTVT